MLNLSERRVPETPSDKQLVSPCDLFTRLVLSAAGLAFEKHSSPRPVLCPDVLWVHLRASHSWTLAWPSLPTLRFLLTDSLSWVHRLAMHWSDFILSIKIIFMWPLVNIDSFFFPNLKPVGLCRSPLYTVSWRGCSVVVFRYRTCKQHWASAINSDQFVHTADKVKAFSERNTITHVCIPPLKSLISAHRRCLDSDFKVHSFCYLLIRSAFAKMEISSKNDGEITLFLPRRHTHQNLKHFLRTIIFTHPHLAASLLPITASITSRGRFFIRLSLPQNPQTAACISRLCEAGGESASLQEALGDSSSDSGSLFYFHELLTGHPAAADAVSVHVRRSQLRIERASEHYWGARTSSGRPDNAGERIR